MSGPSGRPRTEPRGHATVDRPLVTIGIPTYNRSATLARALRSALAQDHHAIEVVVCDNASTDDTAAVVARASETDARVRYVRHPVNIGATANFRSAVDEAAGDYFMWLADDDWLDPGYVTACVETLRSTPGASLAAGTNDYFEGDRYLYSDAPVPLLHERPSVRVVKHLAVSIGCGVFYGVSPTHLLRQVPSRPALGGDVLLVAALAALGTVHLAPTTIFRGVGGESASLDKRLTRLARPCARLISQEIRTDPAFASIPPRERAVTAAAGKAVIYWSYWLKPNAVRTLRTVVSGRRYEQLRAVYWSVIGHP